jgi:hypothetical protein
MIMFALLNGRAFCFEEDAYGCLLQKTLEVTH